MAQQCSNHTFSTEDSNSNFFQSSLASANSIPTSIAVDVVPDASQRSAVPFHGNNDLPRHRRSSSDVPLGFSAMMQSSPQLVPISSPRSSIRAVATASSAKNLGNGKAICAVRVKTEGDAADDMLDSFMNMDAFNNDKHAAIAGNSKTELRADRSAAEQFHHSRSLSMDSSIGHFQFGGSSTTPLTSFSDQAAGHYSLTENLAKISLGEFNEFELKKIMSDERLAEIVTSDPKRVKRILANRQSAARSKERKLRYISELEYKVRTLQTEATTLSTKITILQKDNADLANENNELQLRIRAMQQQAQLRDALHDTLTAEVEHLKHVNMEYREDDGARPNGIHI
ncbi:bZIP transcription factor 30-like isoform X2 [Andrographis paniculata]|uniref:bZIP transcription factor 30-like isoform X2 n=1 Tax=Andrographis paniculata TaxID=175694 RepID=UPI0021E936EA|nr:bZIP transcription factor 30-like isoform X2 [Andrographis paniculata]